MSWFVPSSSSPYFKGALNVHLEETRRENSLSFLPDLDGKLYDAYVAYPSPCSSGYNTEVETFAMHTLPQVLEKACGYKLFIAGRDCLPGQGNAPNL